jgi:glutamate-1-semialdehyde 2,1-aminomutase
MEQTTKTQSESLYRRALRVMPGRVSRNTVLRRPYPSYAAKGEGCRVTDVDGNERIDFANNMASLIHGHAHPAITEAVTAQLKRGTAFTMTTEQELEFAEYMVARVPNFGKIRFVNSGTEAVMSCIKASRAYTGREKIAKVEGSYHGIYDYAEVSQNSNPTNWGSVEHPASNPVAKGTPQSAVDDVIVIPFNDPVHARKILDEHADEIACVLVDPIPHRVGMLPANSDFIATLRAWTRENGALLVFDEVITFRATYSGAQGWYDEAPDLTALGKMIGGGFPVGAIAGLSSVMDVMDPNSSDVRLPHSGTFSANPITMVAGLTAMKLFDEAATERLNALADRARLQIAEAIAVADTPACVTGAGSTFRLHLKSTQPHDYRSCYVDKEEARVFRVLLDHFYDNGIMCIYSGSAALSTVMTEKEIDIYTEVLLDGLRKVREFRSEKNTGKD